MILGYLGQEITAETLPAGITSPNAQDCWEGGIMGQLKCLMVGSADERRILCNADKNLACLPGLFGMSPLWTIGIAFGGLMAYRWLFKKE